MLRGCIHGRVLLSMEKLIFSSITWDILEQKLGIVEIPRQVLFENVPAVQPSPTLVESIRRGRQARLINERDRAYRLISPVLLELEQLRLNRISILPEVPLEIDASIQLSGTPDFLISGSGTHQVVPIAAIIEAKREDIEAGLPQCVAELYVAYLLNEHRLNSIYGCVTTGDNWKFVRFEGQTKHVIVDRTTMYIAELSTLLSAFCSVIDTALEGLARSAQKV